MSSLDSTTEANDVPRALDQIQRSAYKQMGLPTPTPKDRERDDEFNKQRSAEYYRTNPDVDSATLAAEEAKWLATIRAQSNVLQVSPADEILAHRVAELRLVLQKRGQAHRLDKIWFGTVPGGGLDAYSFKSKKFESYGVVI